MPLSKILSASIQSGAAGSNIIEMLSSPCNGSQVTVPSGTYTMGDVTAVQSLTTSFADIPSSSINYTPPSGTTKVIYRYYMQVAYAPGVPAGFVNTKFFLDGTEVTDARRVFYAQYLTGSYYFDYTINCNASSANTSHGDITSWTSAKIMKLQAQEYNSSNQGRLHNPISWDGSTDTSMIIPPILTVISLKDS